MKLGRITHVIDTEYVYTHYLNRLVGNSYPFRGPPTTLHWKQDRSCRCQADAAEGELHPAKRLRSGCKIWCWRVGGSVIWIWRLKPKNYPHGNLIMSRLHANFDWLIEPRKIQEHWSPTRKPYHNRCIVSCGIVVATLSFIYHRFVIQRHDMPWEPPRREAEPVQPEPVQPEPVQPEPAASVAPWHGMQGADIQIRWYDIGVFKTL